MCVAKIKEHVDYPRKNYSFWKWQCSACRHLNKFSPSQKTYALAKTLCEKFMPLVKQIDTMEQTAHIQQTLEVISFLTLGGLVIFQLLHYIVASWRFWENSNYRYLRTASVGLFWLFYGIFFVATVTNIGSYVDAIPYVLAGLYTPSILALLLLLFSTKFRNFVDQVSLKWSIQSVEGPARMIVGIIFLFWFFAGRLPGIVAWVAGPGDWIAGFISFYAVKRLLVFSKTADLHNDHWSITDFRKNMDNDKIQANLPVLRRNLWIAIAFVAFGIFDFIAAPASTAISIANGTVPEEMGRLPLTLIPLVLVPQVLLLEIFAMRQLLGLRKILARAS